MSDKEFYIKGTGWVTWDEAHALGFTHTRPAILTVYTEDLKSRQLIQCKDDVDYNKVYDSVNHIWTDDLTQLGLIRQVGNVELYTGNSSSTYFCYSTSVSEDIPTHVKVNNSLISYNELYSTKGMTSYPCKDFFVEDGILYVWFDSTKSLYWDDRAGKKLWSNTVPDIDTAREPEDIVIKVHPSRIELCPQWEYDLSQMPTRSRTFNFDSQDTKYYDKPDKLISGYSNISNWQQNTEPTIQQSYCYQKQYDKLFGPSSQITDFNYVQQFALDNPAVNFYPDQLYLDMDMFVWNESGVDAYDETHYDYGDSIAETSKKEVWIDADEDTYFWHGTSSYLFPKTHDDHHREMYFIPSDINFTFMDDLYNDGYTTDPGSDVEIFDETLLGVRLWEDTMTLYFTPDKSPTNLPVLDGNPHQAYFRAPSYSGTFYVLASEASLVGNNYVVTVSYYDSWSSNQGTYVAVTDSSTSTTILSTTRVVNGWSSVNSEFVDFSNTTCSPNNNAGGSRSFKLSGGTDGSIDCIPLYYEDGTQVPISDYVEYNITELISKYYLSSVANVTNSYSTSTDVSNLSNLRFVNKDGFIHLAYDSTEPIDNVINIKFKWNNNGSVNINNWSNWENPIYMYFTANGRSSRGIDVNAGTAYPMFYANGNQIPYSDFDGKELSSFVKQIYYSNGVVENDFGDQNYTRLFNNINDHLYFMHKKSNNWGAMIGMLVQWQPSNNHYFYIMTDGSSKEFANSDYWWIRQSKAYMLKIGLIEGQDFIDLDSGGYSCSLLPSMSRYTSIVAAWTDAGADVSSVLKLGTSHTLNNKTVLTVDSTSSTGAIRGYVLKINKG